MMTTYISHPNIAWRVAVECDDVIHRYIATLFDAFCVARDKPDLIAQRNTLTLYETEKGYQIKHTDIVCNDLYHALGTVLELLMSPYFLRSQSYFFLHGAALVKDGKLVTIIAPTQQGKSTATALLVMRGYQYLSDDVIPVNIDTLEVSSFPKALCIRNLAILDNWAHPLHKFFNVMPFCIKSEDNLSRVIESKVPMLPIKTVMANEAVFYKINTVILLERTAQIEANHYELVQLDSGTGYLHLIKNLRAPDQISLFRKVGAQMTRTVQFVKLRYSEGYQYLSGFEEIINGRKCQI